MKFPYEVDSVFIKANGHLVSNPPTGELACFIGTRINYLMANDNWKEAYELAQLNAKLKPEISYYQRMKNYLKTKQK